MPTPSDSTREKWTTAQLMKYFEMRFDNLEKTLDARFDVQEKAVVNATLASEKIQMGTFVTKDELNSALNLISQKYDDINESIKAIQISDAVLAGKATQGQMIIAYVISIIGIIFGIVNIVTK